nr:CatB-related O-acetyltransferase [uncultured Pseudomonas sp.]
MAKIVDFKQSEPSLSARIKQVGVNHNLSSADMLRFYGAIEAPVRISETRIFHDFSIGAFSYVSGGFLYHTHIGRYCSLSNGLHIGQGNHPTDWLSTHPFQYQKLKFQVGEEFPDKEIYERDIERTNPNLISSVPKPQRTTIGNDVWIGHGAFLVNGITIGDGCIIGAHSVVTKDIAPYSIVVGNPARTIKKRFSDEIIVMLLDLKWWNYAPWQLRHIEFDNIERAILQLSELKAMNVEHYEATTININR